MYFELLPKLQLGHQVCQFHVRCWVGKTLKDLQETIPKPWLWVLEEVQQLLDVLHPEGSQRLYALWKQLPGRRSGQRQSRSAMEQLRDLLLRLSRDWRSYCTFQSEPEVTWINNATERVIERMKMCVRTVRGYKSWHGMQSGLILAGSCTHQLQFPSTKPLVFSLSTFRPPPMLRTLIDKASRRRTIGGWQSGNSN